jgi:mRNA-degrading endonuclease toxin of MazEF toxin-antitoxin module
MNLGREQNGSSRDFSRPVLVVQKSNNEMFWVVPLTTKQKALDFYFNFDDPSGAHVAAVLAQLRLVSISRLRRDIYVLPAPMLGEVRMRLRTFLA